MKIDQSRLCVVAICDDCTYRTIRPTPASAWTALAVHAKSVHGDRAAVAKAREAARSQRRRGHA